MTGVTKQLERGQLTSLSKPTHTPNMEFKPPKINACGHEDWQICSKCVFDIAKNTDCEHSAHINECRECYTWLLEEASITDKELAAAAPVPAPTPARLEQASITVKDLAAAWCPHPSVFAALEAGRPAPRRSARLAAKPRVSYEEEELDEEREAREAKEQERIEKEVAKYAKRQAVAAARAAAVKAAKEERAAMKAAAKAVAKEERAAMKAAKDAVRKAEKKPAAAAPQPQPRLTLAELVQTLTGHLAARPEDGALPVFHVEFGGLTQSNWVTIENGKVVIE